MEELSKTNDHDQVAIQNEGDRDEPMPRVVPTVTEQEDGSMAIEVPSDDALKAIYGTESAEAARGLMTTSLEAMGVDAQYYRQFMLTVGVEMKPETAVESMLLIQMCATHVSMMRAAGRMNSTSSAEQTLIFDRIYNQLARTFIKQMEGFQKLRRGPSQTVRVEHVTVKDGGQAIVGNVGKGGGV